MKPHTLEHVRLATNSLLMVTASLSLPFLAGCDSKPSGSGAASTPQVTVTAAVFQGFHVGLGAGTSDGEYVVVVTVSNNGKQPFLCDTIEGKYFPERGRVLTQPVVHMPEGTPITIEPGKPWTHDFGTDGYTTDLFIDANGKPIRFGITIKTNGKDIVGPFSATLPSLSNLPLDHERYQSNKSGVPLQLQTSP